MSDDTVRNELTQYGFNYGSAEVQRAISHKGHVGITVSTSKCRLIIYATPSGQVRIVHGAKLLVRITKKDQS